jgi:hypothetical protein
MGTNARPGRKTIGSHTLFAIPIGGNQAEIEMSWFYVAVA